MSTESVSHSHSLLLFSELLLMQALVARVSVFAWLSDAVTVAQCCRTSSHCG